MMIGEEYLTFSQDSPLFGMKINDCVDDTLLLSEFLTSTVSKMKLLCENLNQVAQTGNALAFQMQRRIGGSSKSTDYISPVMKHFGDILYGITSSQEILAECLQNAFISPLDTFNKSGVSKILGLQQQYKKEHQANDDTILRYLQSDASNTFGIIRSLNQAEIDLRALEVVQQRKKLELLRFDLVRDMNMVKAQKDFEIVEALISAAHALRTHHKECYENLQSSNVQFNGMSEQPQAARTKFLATKLPISMLRDGLFSELDRMIERIETQLPQTLNSSNHSVSGLNQSDIIQSTDSNYYSVGVPSDLNVSAVATHAISRFTSLSASFMGMGFTAPKITSPGPPSEAVPENQKKTSTAVLTSPKVNLNNHIASSSLATVEMRMKALDLYQLEPFYSPHSGQEYIGLIKQSLFSEFINHRTKGYLLERNAGKILQQAWSRQWFVLDDSKLYKIKEREMDSGSSLDVQVVCETMLASIRELKSHEFPFTFEISYANKGTYTLQAEGHREYAAWVGAIRVAIEKRLMSDAAAFNNFQRQGEAPQLSTAAKKRQKNAFIVRKILEENKSCAECGKSDPDWLSLNLGCLICIECSGVHRSLGVHISKVRSLTLDDLEPEEYLLVQRIGNNVSNSIWEGFIPLEYKKPVPNDTYPVREKFIRAKYQSKLFLAPFGKLYESRDGQEKEGRDEVEDSNPASNEKRNQPQEIDKKYNDSCLHAACQVDDVTEALQAIANGADIYAAVYTSFIPVPHDELSVPVPRPTSLETPTSSASISAITSSNPISQEKIKLTTARLNIDSTKASNFDVKVINCRKSPLHVAAESGAIGCCVLLLMNGADPYTSYDINTNDFETTFATGDSDNVRYRGTPFEFAVSAGHDGLASYLRRKLDLMKSGKAASSPSPSTNAAMTGEVAFTPPSYTANLLRETSIMQKETISTPLSDTVSSEVLGKSEVQNSETNQSDLLPIETDPDSNKIIEISNAVRIQAVESLKTKKVDGEVISFENHDDDDLDDFYAALMKDP